MGTIEARVLGAGLCFLVVFVSGFWLHLSGKPFNGILLNVHKLISLVAAVLLVLTLYRANQVAPLGAIELAASVVTGLLFLGTGISGGLLSTGKPMPAALLTAHQIAPFLTVLFTAVTLYLLISA